MIATRTLWGAAGIFLLAGMIPQAPPPQKMDRLIVYGEGFSVGVKEPDGWHGDTAELATKMRVNLVFVPTNQQSLKDDVTIRVRVNKKVDENTIEDLDYDMGNYKKDFPKAQFSGLAVSHGEYKTFARTVFVPREFYEYVAYLNPGVGTKFVLSVAMSKKETPATDVELKAYRDVLQSLAWLSSVGK